VTMIVVDAGQVRRLRALLPALTKTGLQDTLGISETTWVRLRDERPIRRSTYERLMRRSLALASASADRGHASPIADAGRDCPAGDEL